LRKICPFGGATFKGHFHHVHLPLERLFLKGEKAPEIAPDGSGVIPDRKKEDPGPCNGRCTKCRCTVKDIRN
jgi:hypothetical protein